MYAYCSGLSLRHSTEIRTSEYPPVLSAVLCRWWKGGSDMVMHSCLPSLTEDQAVNLIKGISQAVWDGMTSSGLDYNHCGISVTGWDPLHLSVHLGMQWHALMEDVRRSTSELAHGHESDGIGCGTPVDNWDKLSDQFLSWPFFDT